MTEGAEVAQQGGVSAGQAGKEIGEDRGSRCPVTSGKGTRTCLWISFSFKGKGKAQVAGDSSTRRLHKAKDSWAPAQTGAASMTRAEVATKLGYRRK